MIKIERTLNLADRLMRDIKVRKLKKGDGYFTTVQAARFLGVAAVCANRALQLLEKRRVISRCQKKGAVILDPSKQVPAIEFIHFLCNERFSALGSFGQDLVAGIREEVPLSHLYYTALCSRSESFDIKEMLASCRQDGLSHGFVLISSSPSVQKFVAQSGFPSVLLGTKSLGAGPINQLDIDREAALLLLVDHLQKQSRKRFALVVPNQIRPGDDETLNAAAQMGISHFCFLQHDDSDPDLIDELCEWFSLPFDPDGIICLGTNHVIACAMALERLKRDPYEVELTSLFYSRKDRRPIATHVALKDSTWIMGNKLGQLLLHANAGNRPERLVLPLRLRERDPRAPYPQECEMAPSSLLPWMS